MPARGNAYRDGIQRLKGLLSECLLHVIQQLPTLALEDIIRTMPLRTWRPRSVVDDGDRAGPPRGGAMHLDWKADDLEPARRQNFEIVKLLQM